MTNTTHSAPLELLQEIYDDVVQGVIPNDKDSWWDRTRVALSTAPQKPVAWIHVNEAADWREVCFYQLSAADKKYGWRETPLYVTP